MKKLQLGPGELGILAGMLRKVAFFEPLGVEALHKILPHVRVHSYAKGEKVFRKGDRGDAFYIVFKGKVAVRLSRMMFLSKTLATLGPGSFFGEIALISDDPRTADIVCTEPTLLFTLIAVDFQFILRENPEAADEMRRVAARRKFDTDHAS